MEERQYTPDDNGAVGGTQAGSVGTQQSKSVSVGPPPGMDRSDGKNRAGGPAPDGIFPERREAPARSGPNANVTPGGEAVQAVSEQSSDAGSETAPKGETERAKERMERYRALVGGEFKDLFTADTQRIIDRRFKETRSLQEALAAQRAVLERLARRYGVDSGDLAGLSAAVEAEETRRAQEEAQAAQLLEETARRAAEERERALIQNILARGARPAENGAGTQNAVTARLDPGRMTPAQRQDVAQRAARGERITFR